MQRRRRRRWGLMLLAALLASPCVQSFWAGSPLCLVSDGACVTLRPAGATDDWELPLVDAPSVRFGVVELPTQVQSLRVQGARTRAQFDGRWSGAQLTSLLFIGLDLSNTSLPELPPSLQELQVVDCALDRVPVAWLLTLPKLRTLTWTHNTLTDGRKTLTEVTDHQFQALGARLTGDSVIIQEEAETLQVTGCTDAGGSVQSLRGWTVCVVPDNDTAVARRLQTSADSGSDESQGESNSDAMSSASGSEDGKDTSTLVLLSLGLPFLYFLYKVGLAIFFMLTYKKTHGSNGEVIRPSIAKEADIDTTNDSDADRPTANDSSTSPPASPSPRPHRRQDKKPFSSNNAGFWVDEELQPWRLDFQRLKMLKCLNLLPTEKRQTLRKQSVTSALNPREIWLASYASEASTAAVSPGGGTSDTLVVAKFLAPKENQGPRSSASGGDGARDKLKGELKRQAIFSHPQIVAFIGVAWSRETHLVAVTEYMAQGDLRQWLHRTANRQAGKWSVLKVQMLLDVTRALLYLHSMHPRLVHGNCNSRNVLLSTSLRAKLSDFGVDGRSEGLTEQELMSYSAVGSGRWISPEAIMGRDTSASYPDASDVYSFGILIAEMDSHELPFSDLMQANRAAVPETDILQLIARGALTPTLSPTCPKSIVKLVNACTSYKPKYRPSSTQVQQDLLRILEDFREFENQTTATISVGAPSSHRPSNLV